MYAALKSLTVLAVTGLVFAGAASAATPIVKFQPRVTYQGQAPKIVKPSICKNEITRTVNGYTARKCG